LLILQIFSTLANKLHVKTLLVLHMIFREGFNSLTNNIFIIFIHFNCIRLYHTNRNVTFGVRGQCLQPNAN